MRTVFVYVHGLWFSGREAFLLRDRLARALDAEESPFSYPSVSATITDNAASLARHLAGIEADTLHLVGHSLGGVVIARMFELAPPRLPGRVVLLGSPLQGSQAGKALAGLPFGRALLGRGMEEEVLPGRPRRWQGARDLGIIAGGLPFGLGHLVQGFDAPNDGTVLVRETEIEGATAHIVLDVSHTGLLLSATVAAQTAAFLQNGAFLYPGRG